MLRIILALFFLAAFAHGQKHYTPEERAELREIYTALANARTATEAAETRLVLWVKAHDVEPDPPVIEPEPDPDPPVGEFYPDLPFSAPLPPHVAVPTEADCDWTIANGVATSTRGLPSISKAITGYNNLLAPAYRASHAAGHETPVTIGVWDKSAGKVHVGGQYNPNNDFSLSIQENGKWISASLEIVGLDDSCEVELGWSNSWGHADYIGVFNVGIRGPNDSFIIRANDGIGLLVVDGCWWLPNMKAPGIPSNHASGMHIDNWDTLIWRNHKFRGVLPTDPGTLFQEHSGYLKSCVGDPDNDGGTWIVGNNLKGGNRTGFQIRPDALGSARPRGPIVIANNYADGYGFTHGNTPSTAGGGGCLTAWVGPESPVYIFGNTITDARYSCLALSGQPTGKNWANATGHPIESAYIYGNTFDNARADRKTVGVSGVGSVHWWSNQMAGGPYGELAFDSAWNMQVNGILNGSVAIYGQANLDYIKSLDVRTWDPGNPGNGMKMPDVILDSYLVTE